MLQMPQMVALLNGFGGGSSALVSLLALAVGVSMAGAGMGLFEQATAMLGLIVGGVTFSGSMVAAAKLHGLISGRPIVLEGHQALNTGNLVACGVVGALALVVGEGC